MHGGGQTMEKAYKYEIISEEIRREISSGKLQPGSKIPTEDELIKQYAVSRQTVRRAIDCLEQEGILVRRQGSGTYVDFIRAHRPAQKTIGLIGMSVTDYIFPRIIESMEHELFHKHYKLNLSVTQNRLDYEREILQRYISEPVDGLLIDSAVSGLPNPNIHLYKKIKSMGVPILFFNRYVEGLDMPHVAMDYVDGGYSATRYLIQKGHRDIAIMFRCEELQGRQQFKGYCNALLESELPLCDERIIPFTSLQWAENHEQFLTSILKQLRTCTAVVCFNENIAIRLINYLFNIGMRVPEDISVVGFDGCYDSELMRVPLTTFAQDVKLIGKISVEKILNMIAGKPEKSMDIPWKCIERESVQPIDIQ